jgi:sugar phosphate isomerase/epimerase
VRLAAWGVQGFDADEAKSRKVFEFAKAANVRVISADPAPDSFAVLDKLVEEYNINIAIHNHGPGHRYDKIADITKAIDGHNRRIGVCIDTGHFLRFGDRTYGVHLKDVKDKKTFTEIGKGDLRTADFLKELQKAKYNRVIALEYEEHEKDPAPYIEECLTAVKAAIEKTKM